MAEYVTVWVDDLPDLKCGEEIVRCRDCKHGHITVSGEYCKWCDLIAAHDPDGCEPNNGYDPEPYFDADFFCAYGERVDA